MTQENNLNELPENVELVGPGQILSQARQKMGLSQQDVAERLNFRITLVSNIEKNVFDTSLPDTFNRGYLKNYAKLVEIKEPDIIASYEALNIANKHSAKMQSFSKETEKQAQNSQLMWISYLILAVLIGSSVVWWVQDAQNNSVTEPAHAQEESTDNEAALNNNPNAKIPSDDSQLATQPAVETPTGAQVTPLADKAADETNKSVESPAGTNNNEKLEQVAEQIPDNANISTQIEEQIPTAVETETTHIQFTFTGDCWVNIYDATGERVAWGIKKGGYVMEISGQAPFKVTLGKPELVSINFAGEAIDMSQFNRGNIAKFTLPLNAEAN